MEQKYGEFVGVDSLYYSLITADTAAAYTAGTPTFLAPVAEIAGAPKVAKKVTYYENKPANTFNTEGETEIKVVVSNVPAQTAAILLGKYYDATSGRVLDTGKASPPDIALGFRYNMGVSGFRYYWYLKGSFSGGSEDAKSAESDVDVKTYELTFTGITTTHQFTVNGTSQSMKRVFGDTADGAFNGTSWFTAVQTPDSTTAPAAIALSTIVPADAATAIAVSSAVVITFNNKIATHSVILMKSTDGSVVASTKTFDATGKILTLTPSANLTAATKYLVAVDGVVDVYGQTLAAVGKSFTTA